MTNGASLEESIARVVDAIRENRYLLMEFLSPIIDGCRAAMGVSIETARRLGEMTEEEFRRHMNAVGGSYEATRICIRTWDTDESYMVAFEDGVPSVESTCGAADVTVHAEAPVLRSVFASDPDVHVPALLRSAIDIDCAEPEAAVEAIGLLVYPVLLRMAESGIDPSSLLCEDADSLITSAASDLVTKALRAWIDAKMQTA